jgi:anti-sigma-K factor RskA
MTDRESMPDERHSSDNAGAYVLGALEAAEAEAFRTHLATCALCRDEVSAFQEVADLLALTVLPQPVPPALKQRVMASVRGDSRAQPERRRPRLPPWLFSALPTPAVAAAATVLVLVVAIVVVALASGGGAGTRTYSASVSWPGSAKLRVTGGRGELVVRGMPPPPRSKIYEVWLQRGNRTPTPTSALFSVTSIGSGTVDVPGSLHGVDRVLVTPEPLGGSSVPTHVPILVAQLS